MRNLVVFSALVVAFPALDPVVARSAPPQSARAVIRLQLATFDPLQGEPATPPGLRQRAIGESERGIYLVQFAGPVEDAWKAEVARLGGELLEYVADFAFKARLSPSQARRVGRLESVRWVGPFHPAYKLSPRLARGGERPYVVRLERGSDAARAEEAIRATGARLLDRQGRMALVLASDAQVDAMAGVLDVGWIEGYVPREKHNEYAAGAIVGARAANVAGYDGSTQKVAIADTGLGAGTAAKAHADLPVSRIAAIYNWPGAAGSCFQKIVDDGPRDVDTGHGTHVSLSVLGSGDASGRGRGSAPGASLVFQAVENYATVSSFCQIFYGLTSGYYLTGLPLDLHTLLQQAYDAGARVHSDSWGSAAAGDYTADSANTDDFIWSHPSMSVSFSAGNQGVDANADGIVDLDSLGSPATAKNVISVGASENDRVGDYACDAATLATCRSQGGQNPVLSYGESWPSQFPAAPLASDPAAGDAEQMAGFSSRGPTDDGRIKPDVVAPGTWVLSGYSDLYQEGYDAAVNKQNGKYQYDGWGLPLNARYKYMGGTSMANPIVAGGAAVVRDFYQKVHVHAASAALVKATLVNSAVDLLDENNDGREDNALPIPNPHEGWGRVDLRGATDATRRFHDESAGLATGGAASYTYEVTAGTPLKVTLVWSDYPSTEAAARNLVNDLDLEVSGPAGAFYLGNVFARGWSAAGGLRDEVNNVENVYVEAPAAGTWTFTVRGFNVPQGPQPFALVAAGPLGSQLVSRQLSVSLPAHGTVTSGDGFIACGPSDSACSHAYTEGASVTLGATPVPGYTFAGWTGDCAGVSCTLTMDRDHSVAAAFAAIPALSVSDVTFAEGQSGTTSATFTVTLSPAASATVTAEFATADGTATAAGGDYVPTAGTLSFPAGTTSRSIAVSVNGDTVVEPNETFFLSISNPTGATVADGQGRGTILDDDAAPPPSSGDAVVWTAAVGVDVVANSLTKTAAGAWGNAGAVSESQLASGDGYVELTASETTTTRVIGLSNGDSGLGYEDIDFGMDIAAGGNISVFESGTPVKYFASTYASGDRLRVAVVGGVVQYSRNGAVFYTSARVPSYPLLVDSSLLDTGATLSNVVVSGFAAGPPPPPPPPPSTADAVVWTSATGVTVSANALTKTAATRWGNAGAVSAQRIASGDGYAEFTASETSTYRVLGLSNGDTNAGYEDIDFGIDIAIGGQLLVYENGLYRGSFGTYATGDKLRVAVVGGVVRYSRNGSVFYTSTKAPLYPLLVDTSLYDKGSTLREVVIGGAR